MTLHCSHYLFFTNNHSTPNGLGAQHGAPCPVYSLGRPAAWARFAGWRQCLHQPLPGAHPLCGFGEIHWGGLHMPRVHSCSDGRKYRRIACPLRERCGLFVICPCASRPVGLAAVCSAEAVWCRSRVLHSAGLAVLACSSSHETKIHHVRHSETWLLCKSNYQCF